MLCGLAFVGIAHFGTAQSITQVGGSIDLNTTWTQGASPYNLTSPVIVSNGATLTIEAGVTVYLNSYNMQINGILYARGSNDNNIVFVSSGSGSIAFTASSTSWNEQAGTGCIIENSILNLVLITTSSTSPKINNDTITYPYNSDGVAISATSGSPMISNNSVTGDIESINDASPTIINNFVVGGIWGTGLLESTPIIENNTVKGGATISYYLGTGIRADGSNVYIAGNTVFDCTTGINVYDGTSIIEGNLVIDNANGIILTGPMSPVSTTIQYNSIVYNTVGLSSSGNLGSVTISYNNILNNSQYSIGVNVADNWWGTTDQQSIAQILSGSGNFVPFLNAPEPAAPAIPSQDPSPHPTPTPAPTPSPTPTPTVTPSPTPFPTPTPTPISAYPSITLNPSMGPSGTAVVAQLSGFPAYVAIIVTFGTINVGTITSSTGGGSVQFNVPQVSPGTYNITATGTLGGVASRFFFVSQTTTSPTPTPTSVQPVFTQASLNVTPNPVGVGQTVTVTFGLNQLPPTGFVWTNITIRVTYPDGTNVRLGPFTTGANGETSTFFTPFQVGTFTFQMTFYGQTLASVYYDPSNSNIIALEVQQQPVASPTPSPTASPTPTATPTPAPTPPAPNLSFYCISLTTTSGFNVQIQGSLTHNGVGLSGAGIQLSDSVTGGATWQDLAYLKTGNDGNFSCVWNPSVSGYYGIEATWSGDGNYSRASAIYNFAITPFNDPNQNVFSVTSNSTLTSLVFDSATNELSFGVSGPSGTTGFTEVCIPQSLVPNISKLNIMLDNETINYSSVSAANVWMITFTYHHSSHIVVITLGSTSNTIRTVPEFPKWMIIPLFLGILTIAAVLKYRKTNKSNQ